VSEFEGKVAVVTGGSTGIGHAIVDRLSGHGANVVFCTHDEQTLTECGPADMRRADAEPPVVGIRADVRSADDMRRLMATAVEKYGGLDILVCNAGIQTYGTVEDTTEEAWQAVLGTNLTGIYLAAKFALPHMRQRGGGSIVAVSSVQGRTPARRVLGYSVSKAGVDALVRSMAVDHAPDQIRVNAVAPGPVDTPLLRVRDEHADSAAASRAGVDAPAPIPQRGRLAHPAEIAAVVTFLASDSASYVTGATYVVDGWMTVGPGPVLIE
jgi:NAD(P)-dependent dehydrogenase (short-subunit alcohol dehydrogenase family)